MPGNAPETDKDELNQEEGESLEDDSKQQESADLANQVFDVKDMFLTYWAPPVVKEKPKKVRHIKRRKADKVVKMIGGKKVGKKLARKNKMDSVINPYVKYTLFVWHFLGMFVGIGFLLVGSYAYSMKDEIPPSIGQFLLDPASLLLLFGGFIVFFCVLGCYGPLRENTFVLQAFMIILMILFVLELLLLIISFAFFQGAFTLGLLPQKTISTAIELYRNSDYSDSQYVMDQVQRFFKCCGASNDNEGYKDWNLNPYFNCSSKAVEACGVPHSCCINETVQKINSVCGRNALLGENLNKIHHQGCLKGMYAYVKSSLSKFAIILSAVFAPQVVMIFISAALCDQIDEQLSRWTF